MLEKEDTPPYFSGKIELLDYHEKRIGDEKYEVFLHKDINGFIEEIDIHDIIKYDDGCKPVTNIAMIPYDIFERLVNKLKEDNLL